MAVTNYFTVGGRILGEKTTGGTRIDYVRDHLGSVVATTDSAGATLNTYRHKPYGAQLAKTGVSSDPKFLWVGQRGYREAAFGSTYVRSRTFGKNISGWYSVDRKWKREAPYIYGNHNPITKIDPSGLAPCGTCCDSQEVNNIFTYDLKDACAGLWMQCPKDDMPGSPNQLISMCQGYLDSINDENRTDVCSSAKKVLLGVANACNKAGAGERVGGFADAAVVCCQEPGVGETKGEKRGCKRCCETGRYFKIEQVTGIGACMMACLDQHELVHIDQCKGGPPPPPFGARHECEGYLKQTKCIINMFGGKCGWDIYDIFGDFINVRLCLNREGSKDCGGGKGVGAPGVR